MMKMIRLKSGNEVATFHVMMIHRYGFLVQTAENHLSIDFCTNCCFVQQQNDISPTKGALLWSRDCFKILPFAMMQRVARVFSDSCATAELLVLTDYQSIPFLSGKQVTVLE